MHILTILVDRGQIYNKNNHFRLFRGRLFYNKKMHILTILVAHFSKAAMVRFCAMVRTSDSLPTFDFVRIAEGNLLIPPGNALPRR